MAEKKKVHQKEKTKLHARNKHRDRYDFKQLIFGTPDLAKYVATNAHGDDSIDFFNPHAVLMLNKALLKQFYQVGAWSIPEGYLCPPIPGRADYLHYMADLLGTSNNFFIPNGEKIKCLDIGVGANCVYPIIGRKEYGWSFVGSDIDPVSVESASTIAENNTVLRGHVEIRLQPNSKDTFKGIIQDGEMFDLTICNPPFHATAEDAESTAIRKLSNLKKKTINKPVLNFGGMHSELVCEGGEVGFIQDMIAQSREYGSSCFWFSTIVSKYANLQKVYNALNTAKATDIKSIQMSHGHKTSHIVAWTFLTKVEQKNWRVSRWADQASSMDD